MSFRLPPVAVRFAAACALASTGTPCGPSMAGGSVPDRSMASALSAIARASAHDLANAIALHEPSADTFSPERTRQHDELVSAVAAGSRSRDVAIDVRRALAAAKPALDTLELEQRRYASKAFRDLFSALAERPNVTPAAYDHGISGFKAFLADSAPAPECAVANAPPGIAGDRAPLLEPEIARAQGDAGTTIIKVMLDADNDVVSESIYKSSGFALLDHAALADARTQRYESAIVDCRSVAGSYLFSAYFAQ